MKKCRVLLVIEQCNPEWASVPLVGFQFFNQISTSVDVTLVTHERNSTALEKIRGNRNITYIKQGKWVTKYYDLIQKLIGKTNVNWPLKHFLTYPIYSQFNKRVFKLFHNDVINGKFNLVHVITPMMPRYPVKLIDSCKNIPFLLGPVNGGVPFPKGFDKIARKENAHLNFLRNIGRKIIPGYRKTYVEADHIFVGSTYTLSMLKELFSLPSSKLSLFFENGIEANFFTGIDKFKNNALTELLFVGRLVPYKGADMLIEALASLDSSILENLHLTIVGDGPEKIALEDLALKLKINRNIHFAGWIDQSETVNYYKKSDLFCFPSIREFGGAVVLEAMASGLPCIVINNGGIAEYVTDGTGFKIEPSSRIHIINEMANYIKILVKDSDLRGKMAKMAFDHAKEFEWGNKCGIILEKYKHFIENKNDGKERSQLV